MIRSCSKNLIKLSFLQFFKTNPSDNVAQITDTEKKSNVNQKYEYETGWNRIKKIFEFDEFGEVSPELHTVLQAGSMSVFIGAIYGGIIQSREAYMEFMRNNQASKFKTPLEAKRLLQDKVTMGFARGAFRWSWRLALFTGSFVGISTVISSYRGEAGVLEYVIGGAASGALYKFNLGPRGWIVGGGLGATLGLLCGVITLGILRAAGISMHEARYWQYYWKRERSAQFRKAIDNYMTKEDLAVIKLHDDRVGESGKNIENLEENIPVKSKT